MSYAKVKDLKIFPYVDLMYNDYYANNLDFKRHLRGTYATQKKRALSANGRPEKSEYYIAGVLVAIIYFSFQEDANALLENRKEELVYIKNDNAETTRILLKDKPYDPTSLEDGMLIMKEKKQSRDNILDGLKAFIGGFLPVALTQDLAYVIAMTEPFWIAYDYEIRSFVRVGNDVWKDALGVDDLTAHNEWINLEVAVGVTVKDYIISKLTY